MLKSAGCFNKNKNRIKRENSLLTFVLLRVIGDRLNLYETSGI